MQRLNGVISPLLRRVELELLCERSRKSFGGRSQIPIVRSPCTFECPRIHTVPAPCRPILPPTSSRLTIIETLSTPLRCWVTPRHHPQIVFFELAYISAAALISARDNPLSSMISSQLAASVSTRRASKPSV